MENQGLLADRSSVPHLSHLSAKQSQTETIKPTQQLLAQIRNFCQHADDQKTSLVAHPCGRLVIESRAMPAWGTWDPLPVDWRQAKAVQAQGRLVDIIEWTPFKSWYATPSFGPVDMRRQYLVSHDCTKPAVKEIRTPAWWKEGN